MAKKMQRALAWMLALALCAGQLIIPIRADGSDPASVTITEIEGGTQTVTVTTNSDGSQTTTTNVTTSDPSTNTTSQSTTTEVVSGSGGQTNVDTTWTSTTTTTDSTTESGNPTVQTDTDITTTVTGSENTTVSKTTNDDGSKTQTGRTSGEESTTITGTTVTTTTTKDVLLETENESRTETDGYVTEKNESTDWNEGTVTEGQWVNGEVEKDDTLTTTDTTTNSKSIDVANPGEAVIEMTPDGKTVEVEVDVTIDQVLAGMKIPEGAVEIRKDGKLIGYKITTVTETSTQNGAPVVGDTVATMDPVQQTYVTPSGYTEGTVQEDNVTTLTEAIRDDNGNIIGYRVTKTTVTENVKTETSESDRETTTTTATGESAYTLPQRPAESESTDDVSGYVTKTTVEDILNGDQIVGYKSTTTYYDDRGEVLRTETNSIYGTSSSTQTWKDPETEVETVTTTTTKVEVNEIYTTVSTRDVTLVTERVSDITTTIVTEEDTYQLVETEDGLYFLYKGTMQKVVALQDNGIVNLEGLKPTVTPNAQNDLANRTSITNPPSLSVDPGAPGSDQFKYVDYGLISDFRVTKADGNNTSEVHLYKLVDKDGNAYYAYCADLDTTAYRKTIYDISNAKDENYYQNNAGEDAYAHLQAIAISGYWGTSSGTGSIDAIKSLLDKAENRAYLKACGYTDAEIDKAIKSLTDGEAMTATQAAIWTFGNKSSTNLVNTNNPAKNVSDKNARQNINILYDLLISDVLQEAVPNNETDIITEKDISGAKLELKGHATDASGQVKSDSEGNKKYNADLTFTLKVEESALTGNLTLRVTDENGNKLCNDIQLITENSNLLGKVLGEGGGYSYTIEDLEIAEGITINLNLEGYQNLKKGVYIYTAATGSYKDSQTFIGIAEGERKVDLQTSLSFTVEDPQLEHVEKTVTQVRNDTRTDRKEDSRTDTKYEKQEAGTVTITVVTDTKVEVYGTETVTETEQDVTKEERSWESEWRRDWRSTNDDSGNSDSSDEDEQTEKMAKAPKTGDLSGLWALIGGLSLGGMGLLNRKRREE